MRKFLVVFCKTQEQAAMLGRRAREVFDRECPFHVADFVTRYYEREGIFLASAAPRQTGFGSVESKRLTDDGFFLFDGFPLIDGVAQEIWATQLFAHYKARGLADFHDTVSGEYCFVSMHNGIVNASGDFAGQSPLFTYEFEGMVAISNRQRLLHRALHPNGRIDLDPAAFSWLTGQGQTFGTASPFKGVELVPPGRYARIKDGVLSGGGFPRFYAPGKPQAELSISQVDEAVESIHAQARQIGSLDLGSGLVVDLTGGFDSRSILAVCLASGLIDKIGAVRTEGHEGSPEIEVAAAVCKAVGVEHTASYTKPPSDSPDASAHWRRLRISASVSDGTVIPHTSVPGISRNFSARFGGGAGEIFRHHTKARVNTTFGSLEEVMTMAENYQQTTDPFNIQRPETTRWQKQELRKLARGAVVRGANFDDVHFALYAENRLPWWAGYTRANAMGSRRINLLANRKAAALFFQGTPEQRSMSRFHFELMRAGHPELIKVPFLKNKFDSRLSRYANGVDLPGVPFPIQNTAKPTARTNWMLDFIKRDHEKIFEYILDAPSSVIFDSIDRDRFAKKHSDLERWSGDFLSACSVLSVLQMRIIENDDFDTARQGEP